MTPNGRFIFVGLLLGQAVGAVIIIWQCLPIYHYFLSPGPLREASMATYFWVSAAIILTQTSYWTAWRKYHDLKLPSLTVLGHVLQFMSRLAFIFASSLFVAAYISRVREFEFRLVPFILIFAALFSVFCFALELERVGKGLAQRRPETVRFETNAHPQ